MFLAHKAKPRKTFILAGLAIFFCALSSFALAASPTVGTISPSSGISSPDQSTIFTTTYIDRDGWKNIQLAYLLFNTSQKGANCFYGHYNQNTNKLYLRNDANTAWLGGYTPGSNYTIKNSYATLNCLKTTVSGSGTVMTIKWDIAFKSAFAGAKNVYLNVKDDAGANSGWLQKGAWTVLSQPDILPPTGTIKINGDAQYTKSQSVTLNILAADSGSGMNAGSQMSFSNDDILWSAPEAYALAKAWTLSAEEGTKTVLAKFKDTAGNWSTMEIKDSIILDKTPPEIKITAPAQNSYSRQTPIYVTGTISEPGLPVKVNGVPAAINAGIFTASGIILNEGANTITAEAYDPAGNRGFDTITVNLDTVAPDFTITSPQDASYIGK